MTATATWNESTVAEEFDVQLGKRLDAAVNRGEPRWCINNRGVRWGRVIVSEAVQAPLSPSDIRDLRLVAGDVLMCEGGEIGRAAVWRDQLPEAYFLNTLHRLRSKGRYHPHLLAALFERWAGTGELSAIVGKATLAHLTKENLVRISLPVPPPDEQTRIAEALQDADALLASLERLVTKKQAVKQSMMQQLLTGRTRFPGFSTPWQNLQLLNLVSIRNGQVDPTLPEYRDLPLIAPDHVESATGHLLKVETARAQGAISGKYLVAPGDIVYSKIRPYLQKVVLINFPALCSADMYPLTPNTGVDGAFILHTLLGEDFTNFAASVSARSGIPKLNRVELAEFALTVPQFAEQQAISAALDDASNEISALRLRVTKANGVKRGMMQQLLTGRTRLPTPRAAS